jgi:hypothetical protein
VLGVGWAFAWAAFASKGSKRHQLSHRRTSGSSWATPDSTSTPSVPARSMNLPQPRHGRARPKNSNRRATVPSYDAERPGRKLIKMSS